MKSQPLILMARSTMELDLWLKALLVSMDCLYPSENREVGHDLQLCGLAGSSCSVCKKRFLGIIGQGYRCRACRAVLHKHCIASLQCPERLSQVESPIRRTGSIALPVFFDRYGRRRSWLKVIVMIFRTSLGSTLSLNRASTDLSGQVRQLKEEWEKQHDQTPLHSQDWFAGNIDIKTATERIRSLPVGTFLVRTRGHQEDYALDLKTRSGVKHMKIYFENDENFKRYSFSRARVFPTLGQLIGFYRSNDLLENFGYKEMEGMRLVTPYKSA